MLIPYSTLLRKYKFKPKGIFHLGAHQAEEAEEYHASGVHNVIWFEGNPELIPALKQRLSKYSGNQIFNALISDVDNADITLNITNETMSSSILGLSEHLQQYPGINVVKTIELKSTRLDSFINAQSISIEKYDFLNIDIQGAELLALKGLGNYIRNFKFIYTEVNLAYLYDGCPLLEDLDLYLGKNGFKRVETSITESLWGDALYMQAMISEEELKESIKEAKKLKKYYNKIDKSRKFRNKIKGELRKIPFLKSVYFFFRHKK